MLVMSLASIVVAGVLKYRDVSCGCPLPREISAISFDKRNNTLHRTHPRVVQQNVSGFRAQKIGKYKISESGVVQMRSVNKYDTEGHPLVAELSHGGMRAFGDKLERVSHLHLPNLHQPDSLPVLNL